MSSSIIESAATRPVQPFFSVCIPTYNRGYCLANAIRSVLGQDFTDFELLISDNASADDTRTVVEQFDDPRIRSLFWPELVSMYANHNRCIEHARADWIVFLHSDDALHPDALLRLHELILLYSPEVIYGPLSFHGRQNLLIHDVPHLDYFFNYAMSPSGTAYKRQLTAGPLRFAEDTLAADLAFNLWHSLNGGKSINCQRGFVDRAFDKNTCMYQASRGGEWNLVLRRLLAPYFNCKPIRKQVVADTTHRNAAELSHVAQLLSVCGHPSSVCQICMRGRLVSRKVVKEFAKATIVWLLGIDAFMKLAHRRKSTTTT